MVAVAQWQSIALWMRGLWVQPPSATLRDPIMGLFFNRGKAYLTGLWMEDLTNKENHGHSFLNSLACQKLQVVG